ncbi:hypothetical protein AA106556_0049 [Neokomagataea tanensis NBRC 106556]|uniref:Transposase n=1 Tax=Neokomagataea tanensis NBRC 106556 TaxID=1223519 RepID=A0ABQ0QFX6_9PROT|nr:hypothetical protein AA106556_0049 [Neokomagataea tanensis NBRC 106556]
MGNALCHITKAFNGPSLLRAMCGSAGYEYGVRFWDVWALFCQPTGDLPGEWCDMCRA